MTKNYQSKNHQEDVAQMFIRAMEEGTAPWQRSWSSSPFSLMNGVTGHEYSGMNVVLLSMNPYNDHRYCTFKQAKENGYLIKKGSRGSIINYCCPLKIKDGEETEETDEIDEKIVFMRKYFCVFNFEQMEGVPELKIEDEQFNPTQKCEEVLNNFDLKIEESAISDKAFYRLNDDNTGGRVGEFFPY